MDPIIGSALIAGGANLLGNLFGAKSQSDANKQNFEYSQRLLQQQMDYNTEMWNKSNEYNAAAQQRKRLEEAGLNPYLMLQGGNAGSAVSALGVSPNAPQAQASRFDFSGIANAANSIYDNAVKNAQVEKLRQEAQAVQIENEYRSRNIVANLAETWSRTKNNEARTYLEREIRKQTLNNMGQEFVNKQREQYGLELANEGIRLDNNMKALQLENLPIVFKQEIALRAADYQLKLATGELTRNQAKHEISKDILTMANTKKVDIDRRTAERCADAIVDKARADAMRSQQPQNIWQGMNDAADGFNDFVEEMIVKPSKKMWKDTKRSLGIR